MRWPGAGKSDAKFYFVDPFSGLVETWLRLENVIRRAAKPDRRPGGAAIIIHSTPSEIVTTDHAQDERGYQLGAQVEPGLKSAPIHERCFPKKWGMKIFVGDTFVVSNCGMCD